MLTRSRIRYRDDLRSDHRIAKAGLRRPWVTGTYLRKTGPKSVRHLTCACGWEVSGPASDLNEHEADVFYREHIGRVRVQQEHKHERLAY